MCKYIAVLIIRILLMSLTRRRFTQILASTLFLHHLPSFAQSVKFWASLTLPEAQNITRIVWGQSKFPKGILRCFRGLIKWAEPLISPQKPTKSLEASLGYRQGWSRSQDNAYDMHASRTILMPIPFKIRTAARWITAVWMPVLRGKSAIYWM